MTTEQFASLAVTTLNASMDGSQTTCVVVSATPFPSSPQYRIQIDSELMLVTGGTGTTTWTITRGTEGTSAASHVSGSRVTHVLTAASIGGQSDPAAGVPGLRSLGTGAQQAAAGTEVTRALAAEALLAPLASPSFTGVVATPAETITNPSASVALQVTQNANAPSSTSVGGAVNVNNSGSTGAGLVVYSSQGSPVGRLIVARADNAAFSQAAIYAENAGTGHAVFANQTVVTPNSTGSAINAVSANSGASAVQVSGVETGRGSVKVTHTGTGSDANASGLSIDLQGSGTAAQGIFIDSTTSGTTGALIQVRNNGNVIWKLATDGTFAVPVLTVAGITETYGTAAPVSGTWTVGSRVWNTLPEAGGNMGWVCISAGTPGTWKPFGLIGT